MTRKLILLIAIFTLLVGTIQAVECKWRMKDAIIQEGMLYIKWNDGCGNQFIEAQPVGLMYPY